MKDYLVPVVIEQTSRGERSFDVASVKSTEGQRRLKTDSRIGVACSFDDRFAQHGRGA